MKKSILFGAVIFGLWAGEAMAQQPQGYPTGKPKCRSREVWEGPISNAAVSIQGFCRPKEKDGYRWQNDQYGGFFTPLVQRPGYTYAKGYGKDGHWVEVGWQQDKPNSVWVDGHYNADGTWSAGRWEKGAAGQEWVNGFWKDNRWQDGYWRDIPSDSYCPPNQVYVESIFLDKLQTPEFCRENNRAGYSWVNDQYGGYWQPTSIKPGQVFIRGHATGDFGSWSGESWEAERPGFFFVQGRYDSKGGWISGEWKEVKRGYTWIDGKWGTDGSWTPGSWTYDPSKACPSGAILEEEIKLPKLFVPRYCRDSSRIGYNWNDSPYGGFWEPTTIKPGQVFIRGHIDGEFGNYTGENWEVTQADRFFIQGRYDAKGNWLAGEWKEIKKGYRWQDGSWGTDGSWRPGEYIFDPASYCTAKQTYVEEIKLSKEFVPRFCRDTNRPGYSWVNDPYGGYWQLNSQKPNQVFVRGHIDAEFGTWTGERIEAFRPGFAFEQGHYDSKGGWVAGDWKEITPGYKWNPGKYNTDGSWIAGSLVEDPYWTPTCNPKTEALVSAVNLPNLKVMPFCREKNRKGFKWVASPFGGWWAPDVKGYSTGSKVFVRGHYDVKAGWTGEAFVEAQPGKIFVQGHYGPKGEWVEGKWIEAKPGFTFQEGSFDKDGNWTDGKWVESNNKGGYKGTGSGGGY